MNSKNDHRQPVWVILQQPAFEPQPQTRTSASWRVLAERSYLRAESRSLVRDQYDRGVLLAFGGVPHHPERSSRTATTGWPPCSSSGSAA
jgi:hypothetical protein